MGRVWVWLRWLFLGVLGLLPGILAIYYRRQARAAQARADLEADRRRIAEDAHEARSRAVVERDRLLRELREQVDEARRALRARESVMISRSAHEAWELAHGRRDPDKSGL